MWWLVLVVLAAACASSQAQFQREICYATDLEPYIKFATKTAYEFVSEKSNTQQHVVPNCEPVLFWSLNRHGATLPSGAKMMELRNLERFQQSVLSNYDNGAINRNSNVRLCRQDVDNLRLWRWNPNHNATFAGDLTSQGYLETQTIARTWRSRYPHVMTNDPNDYLFKFVDDRRNRNSFQAYTEGIFGQRASTLQIPRDHDPNLEAFKKCATWKHDVEQNKDTMTQVNIFTSKEEFKTMVMNISSRLGYSYRIHNSDVDNMWEMCRLNKAWDLNLPSPWCAVFTRDDLKRMEYIEDLKSYYGSGYGSPLNAKLGCSPIKDLVQFFSKYVNSPFITPQPKAVVSFTQSATLLMTLSAMGAYQDTVPLTGDNFHTPLMDNRKWRTSDIDPFSANLVAVLYRCRDNGEQFRVMFFLNERPVLLNGCAVGLCDWSWVKNTYGHVADKCDVKKFCKNGGDNVRFSAAGLAMVVLVAIRSLF